MPHNLEFYNSYGDPFSNSVKANDDDLSKTAKVMERTATTDIHVTSTDLDIPTLIHPPNAINNPIQLPLRLLTPHFLIQLIIHYFQLTTWMQPEMTFLETSLTLKIKMTIILNQSAKEISIHIQTTSHHH